MVAYWRACYISACTIRSDFLGTDSVLFRQNYYISLVQYLFVPRKIHRSLKCFWIIISACLKKTTNKKGRNVWPDSWSLRNSVGEMPAGYLWAFPEAKFRESDSPWNLCVLGFWSPYWLHWARMSVSDCLKLIFFISLKMAWYDIYLLTTRWFIHQTRKHFYTFPVSMRLYFN